MQRYEFDFEYSQTDGRIIANELLITEKYEIYVAQNFKHTFVALVGSVVRFGSTLYANLRWGDDAYARHR